MKVLFCDDDLNMLKQIENDFTHYFYRKIENLQITMQSESFNNIDYYDLCFLDIDLIEYDGIKLAEQLKAINKKIIIIFISQREDLVFKSLSVQPFQFIRKKYYKEDLQQVFLQLNTFIQHHTITLKLTDQKIVHIRAMDILSVISLDHDVIITTLNTNYTVKDSLKNFCQMNQKNFIVQIKKNFAISLYNVEQVKGSIVLYDHQEYKIGRCYQKNFKKLYERYLIECF